MLGVVVALPGDYTQEFPTPEVNNMNNYIKVPLGKNAKDGYAKVDETCKWLLQYEWHWSERAGAITMQNKKKLLMHRLITSCPEDKVVDHANHDRRDNRKNNLRVCTKADNNRNSRGNKPNTTGYRGVSRANSKFRARIRIGNNINLHLGVFDTASEAASAYKVAAKKYHKEFAYVEM